MSDTAVHQDLALAAEFPATDRADWVRLVEKALKDRPFDRLISKTYELKPHEFLQQQNLSTRIIADANPNVGDLRNVQVEFRVVGGEGAVMVFTSSIDNGSADQLLRTE